MIDTHQLESPESAEARATCGWRMSLISRIHVQLDHLKESLVGPVDVATSVECLSKLQAEEAVGWLEQDTLLQSKACAIE